MRHNPEAERLPGFWRAAKPPSGCRHLPHKGGDDKRQAYCLAWMKRVQHAEGVTRARRRGRVTPSPLWGGLGGVFFNRLELPKSATQTLAYQRALMKMPHKNEE
jgi:hypothetical protein